jgi:hypothetical protein
MKVALDLDIVGKTLVRNRDWEIYALSCQSIDGILENIDGNAVVFVARSLKRTSRFETAEEAINLSYWSICIFRRLICQQYKNPCLITVTSVALNSSG